MVERLINEINRALDCRLYLVALNTALTLPDICGKAAYPNLKTSERYKKWYEEYIGRYEKGTKDKDGMPYLSADVVYQLRCALSHQGNPNVGKEKTGIDCFELVIEVPQDWIAIYADCSSICQRGEKTLFNYRVSIHGLCVKLCLTAQNYYKKNMALFNFFNYKIIDMEEEVERMKPYWDCIKEFMNEERRRALK